MAAPFNNKQVGGRKGQPMKSGTVLGSNTPGGAKKKGSSGGGSGAPFNTTRKAAPAKRPNVPFNTGAVHPLAAAVAKHLATAPTYPMSQGAGPAGHPMDSQNPAAIAYARHMLAATGAPASFQHAPDPAAAWRAWSAQTMNAHPAGYNVGSGYQAPVPAAVVPDGGGSENFGAPTGQLAGAFLANAGVGVPARQAPTGLPQGAAAALQRAIARLHGLAG